MGRQRGSVYLYGGQLQLRLVTGGGRLPYPDRTEGMTGVARVVIVGAGHNGLVAGCYLAKAGAEVLVCEQSVKPGGGSRTDELLPGYRFDTHSVAHNMINMTGIPDELGLADTGLEYVEMDPFAVAAFADAAIVRFHRDIDQAIDSIRSVSAADADAYGRFMALAVPVVRAAATGVAAGASPRVRVRLFWQQLWEGTRALWRYGGVTPLLRELASPYERVLQERLVSDRTRAPVAAFAAHASAGPASPGSALFALWQAVYHVYGQWHAVGGAQGLTDALVGRLRSLGGEIRCGTAVASVDTRDDRVQGVTLADGARVPASVVVTAVDPRVALLELLRPALSGSVADELRATQAGNAVQMLVHLALDRLPAYGGARPGDHNGLQSYVDSLDDLKRGFAAAEAHRLPGDPVPTYAFTTSALDPSLAPPGHHTMYLACPCAPFTLDEPGGWAAQAAGFAERMIDTVQARVPGFRDTIVDMRIRTPADMASELRWPGAHPMHLDISLHQLGPFRPTASLSGHDTPVRGLFITGAGTSPVGGIAGSPGLAAAKAVLARHGAPRR